MTYAIEGATGPLLAHMVEKTSLSKSDLDALQALIDAKKLSLKKRAETTNAKKPDRRTR